MNGHFTKRDVYVYRLMRVSSYACMEHDSYCIEKTESKDPNKRFAAPKDQ